MKEYFKIILIALMAIALFVSACAQDEVANIMDRLPGENTEQINKLAIEISELGADKIARLCDFIVPPGKGKGNDTKARYAISALVRYAGAPGNSTVQKTVESAILQAIDKASNIEVKNFFIRELAFCGQPTAIPSLGKLLSSNDTYAPALATITTIGTDEAGKVIVDNIEGKTDVVKAEFVKALGELQYEPAAKLIESLTASEEITKQAFWALAKIGSKSSAATFKTAANRVNYAADKNEIILSYLQYAKSTANKGYEKLSSSIALDVLKNCTATDLLHYRSSALKIASTNKGETFINVLLKEIKNEDKAYRQAVLNIASDYPPRAWIKAFSKMPDETKVNLLYFLAPYNDNDILSKVILPSLASEEAAVRHEAIKALAINQKETAIPTLLNLLAKTNNSDYPVIEQTLLSITSTKQSKFIADELASAPDNVKPVLIRILEERRATDHFDLVKSFSSSGNHEVSQAAPQALVRLAVIENAQEKAEGFEWLFNGSDLDNWIGNKTAYIVDNGTIHVMPKAGGSGGNLYTRKEYSDFIFRFDFKLTAGANNGLGIHAPLEGDAAYVGKELQILDNDAPVYANLQKYQYHGSVYGIIAAKQGFLKPIGEWNSQEVIVKGDDIKITLNGEVILDANLKEAVKGGIPDKKEHPGLDRYKGHIGFLGHGSELWFKNIRIKEL